MVCTPFCFYSSCAVFNSAFPESLLWQRMCQRHGTGSALGLSRIRRYSLSGSGGVSPAGSRAADGDSMSGTAVMYDALQASIFLVMWGSSRKLLVFNTGLLLITA